MLEWVREAFGDRFRLKRELGRGGMGLVYLAYDTQLDCDRAIKVLLPELATAEMAGRFVREARIMAKIKHPNVVPIHDAGQRSGLFYYVMDYIEGPTLLDRLSKGTLSRAETLKLGRDLLDALEAVHAQGYIHCDVKPSNIFMGNKQAQLADFGIATPSPESDDPSTQISGGTPGYMAPEQARQEEITPRADLFAVAMVLYEASSGRHWDVMLEPHESRWAGVGFLERRILARALEHDPADRWPDAATFRRRWWHVRVIKYRVRAAMLTVGGAAFGVLMSILLGGGTPEIPERVGVAVVSDSVIGPSETQWLADSLPRFMALRMGNSPDFRVCQPDDKCPSPSATIRVSIRADSFYARLSVTYEGERSVADIFQSDSFAIDDNQWRIVGNEASSLSLRAIWDETSPLREYLPNDALPRTPDGWNAWFAAERLFNHAQWSDARTAFQEAFARDATCLLCSWRITEIQRWLVEEPDPDHLLRTIDGLERFPEHYQALIRVRWEQVDERLRILEEATERWGGFPYAWFLYGDELLHRGPLVGRRRTEAIEKLRRATDLDSTFGPAWQHLEWAAIAQGDRRTAEDASRQYDGLLEREVLDDDFARALRAVTKLAKASRFKEPAGLGQGDLGSPLIGAAPRYLAVFELREAMMAVGAMLIELHQSPGVQYSARIATLLASVAQGRMQDAADVALEIQQFHPEHAGFGLFALKLQSVLLLVDSATASRVKPDLIPQLAFYESGGLTAGERSSAAWMRAMLDVADAPAARVPPLPAALDLFLRAYETRSPEIALSMTQSDRVPFTAERMAADTITFPGLPDPFYRTLLRFARAQWWAEMGNPLGAANELLFYEADDINGFPLDLPLPAEVDWAFGTLARWRRALLLVDTPQSGAACGELHVVAVRWSNGDEPFRARADSAQQMRRDLKCPPMEDLGW